jgi:hypothetical protein
MPAVETPDYVDRSEDARQPVEMPMPDNVLKEHIQDLYDQIETVKKERDKDTAEMYDAHNINIDDILQEIIKYTKILEKRKALASDKV